MTVKTGPRGLRSALMNAASAASIAAAAVIGAGSASAIVINDNYTATDAVDTAGGINGVGQFVTDIGGGSVGLCTATLINARTVIFAAHCVNEEAASAYGVGGTDAAIFFNVVNNSNPNPYVANWYNSAGRGTNIAGAYYRLSQIQYNAASLEPDANGFLYGDVAIGTLDTPAAGIPTWAMLFSPLPDPGAIDPQTGTGYHVDITGYGSRGTATSGSIGIDFRRRAAENMLGGLTSLEEFEGFLFGGPSNGLPQNLYFIDFDSPNDPSNTDSGRSSPYDFNAFRDDFTTREGTTAGGDSGGPLILDAANNAISTRNLILGVLSGGYTRFFNGAPANGYGTVSFYQPLYLYWDYIAAANPYRYVGANAGNGNWEDTAHWTSLLDPNYYVISGSTAVNGIPTAPGAGPIGDEPEFGDICFYGSGFADCLNTTTNVETFPPLPVDAAGNYDSDIGHVTLAGLVPELSNGGAETAALGNAELDPQISGGGSTVANLEYTAPEPQTTYLPGPNPGATIANGLPGATNFTPNNIDPTSGGVLGRYFDVTLSAAGMTTLSSAVTIDKLTVRNTAGLTVAAAGNLTSLINVTQISGSVAVNGRLTSVGDYTLASGILSGTGFVNAPFLTNLAGAIAPGTAMTSGGGGTVGLLTIEGSTIFSSGSSFLVDVGGAASADRLNVTGALNLGGTFWATTTGSFMPTFGNSWTVANAAGGISGSFNNLVSNFAGVLSPQLTVTGNNLVLSIIAANFTDVADFTSPEQIEVASTLDVIRDIPGGFTALSGLFGSLDQMSADDLPFIMEALTPLNGFVAGGLAEANAGVVAGALVDRTDQLMQGGGHGFDAGNASAMLNASALQASADPFDAMMMGVSAVAAAQDAAAETAASAASIKLREGWGGFLDVTTMLDTTYEATPFAGDADFNGTGGTLGFDYGFSDGSFAGAALSYVSTDSDVFFGLQTADSESWGVSAYGGVHEGASFLTGYVGYAMQSYDLSRTVPLMMGTQTLTASPDGTIFSAGAKMGFDFEGAGGTFTPYGSIDGKWINIDGYTETGGPAALIVGSTDTALVDGRIGLTYTSLFQMDGGVIRPKLGLAYVIDVQSDDNVLNSAFAAFPGQPLTFIGSARDNGWAEYEVGLEYEASNFGISVNYTGGDNGVLNYGTLSGRVSVAW